MRRILIFLFRGTLVMSQAFARAFDATRIGAPAMISQSAGWRFHDELPGSDEDVVADAESVATGSKFTFVSDSVVEAENAPGELFRFDRAREISNRSAQRLG